MRLWYQRESKTPVLALKPLDYHPERRGPVETTVSGCCLGFKETTTEYCMSTSLHGLQYMGRTGHFKRERWFWLLSLLTSVGASCHLIVKLYLDYSNNPVETVFDPTPRRLQEFPFPAVTFCNPDNWLSESAFTTYTREMFRKPPGAILNADEVINLAKVKDMVDLCAFGAQYEVLVSALPKLEQYFHAHKHQIESFSNHVQTIADISPKCQDVIPICYFKKFSCEQHITGIVTDKGYCCVFNAVPVSYLIQNRNVTTRKHEHWSDLEMELFYYDDLLSNDKQALRNWPLKQSGRGLMEGLLVELNHTAPSSICPRQNLGRSYVYVSSQLDLPAIQAEGGVVNPGNRVIFNVQPDVTLSDKSINFLSKEKRNCYVENEYNLQWHKHYTQATCIEECRIRDLIKTCNCVPFTPFCNFSETCHVQQGKKWKETANPLTKCAKCLPTCTEIQYNTDSSSQPSPYADKPELSQVFVHMDFNVVHPRLRKQSMTMVQFLSNAGGLLGLFLGFSVFSLLEMLYYSTLCIRRARRRNSSTI